MKRDFIVFSIGDPRRTRTWSNMPYFFTRTLADQGHRVQVVNIAPPRAVQLLFDVPWKWACRILGYRTRFTFLRSGFNRRVTEKKIAKALRKYPEGHCVFMTFSFGTGNGRPFTLFCDQTFEQHIQYFDERPPNKLERPTVVAERKNLREATMIIALFPELAKMLRGLHGDKVKYYGNVLNLGEGERIHVDPPRLLARKRAVHEVVFIGNKRYKEGLEILARALEVLNRRAGQRITVNVIGMDRKELPWAPDNMLFHGYLDKRAPDQKRLYVDILERSRLFVNPHPKWAAFSASSEALYYCTPVVILPYTEFERTFGSTDRVGYPLGAADPEAVAGAMALAFADEEQWARKAMAGHQATKEMTWDRYVERYLEDLATMERRGGSPQPFRHQGVHAGQ